MIEELNRKEFFLAAWKEGRFLETVYSSYLDERKESKDLALDIAALHNDGLIDVVAEFENLTNGEFSEPDFFLTRHVFEMALPYIDAPVNTIMRTVLHLSRSAGQDLAAGTIFDGYVDYCANDSVRPKEALQFIETDPDQFVDMLPATIAAGSRLDYLHYVGEVTRLCQHPEKAFRQRAVFSFSCVQWPNGASIPDCVILALEKSVAEADDIVLANVLKAAFNFYLQDKATEPRVTSLIRNTLEKGDEHTLHVASTLLGSHTKEIQTSLLDSLLSHLKLVKPANRGTIDQIDFGLAHILKGDHPDKALLFLEELLLAHPKALTIKVFDSAAREIVQNRALLSKLMTRWFLNGERVLCEGVREIVEMHHGADIEIEIDSTELVTIDFVRILFVARKAIGYLFITPVTAISIVISLMRHAPNDETLEQLSQLLFDPLLLNYTGLGVEYVKVQGALEPEKVKANIDKALLFISSYLEALRSIPALPTLHPSQSQRESYWRYMTESTETSRKAAEKKSSLLSLFTRQTLLYGRKSINYIHTEVGEPQRMEIPLTSHSVEMEFPRMVNLDEFGVNYMLRVFRVEHICS